MKHYGSKADKAGGCMGEKQAMKSYPGVAIGQQKNVDFMSDKSMMAPKMKNDKAHSFMPGVGTEPNIGGKKQTQPGKGGY